MTKDFNRDLDQSGGQSAAESESAAARKPRPTDDAEGAKKRIGEGFKGPGDEYAESGSRGAGYRETKPAKK